MKLNCKKNCKIIGFVAYFSKIYGYISKKIKNALHSKTQCIFAEK